MRLVKLGLAAVNTTVGALRANVDAALTMAQEMARADVTIALFPEQLIPGYPQEDLVQWQAFIDRQWEALTYYAQKTKALPLVSVLGISIAHQGLRYNCAAVLAQGHIHGLVPKEKLPLYDIFYEARTFSRGYPGMKETHNGVPLGDMLFQFDFGTLGVEVCEDMWSADGPMRRRAYSGAEVICNLSASPFRVGIHDTRRHLVSVRANDNQCTVAHVNQVGAQDGLIFDGGGCINQNGRMLFELPRFRENWGAAVVDLNRSVRLRTENSTWRQDCEAFLASTPKVPTQSIHAPTQHSALRYPPPHGRNFFLPREDTPLAPRVQYCEELLDALALGLCDYFEKTRKFSCLGVALSGGRDSLLTLLIAHRYASQASVPLQAFSMPTRHSSPQTRAAAQLIAQELNVPLTVISIDEAYEVEVQATQAMLGPNRPLTPKTLQNIQARLRAQRMWNWANTSQGLFLQTGNMSEKAVGYTTVGGDLMGALAVIANLPKTVVCYLLAYLYEKHGYQGIAAVIAQPPSPELAPNQRGEDELMPFHILDACFHLFAGEKLGPAEVLDAMGAIFPEVPTPHMESYVKKFVHLFTNSIYKWVQSPVSLHVGTLDLDRERALQLPVVTQTDW